MNASALELCADLQLPAHDPRQRLHRELALARRYARGQRLRRIAQRGSELGRTASSIADYVNFGEGQQAGALWNPSGEAAMIRVSAAVGAGGATCGHGA
jgi:hypothetical protein